MIPNLPRPLLWTEIKTMREFLNGDLLTRDLYEIFKKIKDDREYNHLPYVNDVTFFNELYYQLTRYYYEKPDCNDYERYYNDIRTNLGGFLCSDLVMTMMYHYCRLRDTQFLFWMDSFMKKVENEQEVNNFWMYFTSSFSTVNHWPEIVPYPQKICPVAPEKLENIQLKWKDITRIYDLETIQELLEFWGKNEDQIKVSMILKVNLEGLIQYSSPSKREIKKYNKAISYLEDITGTKRVIKDSSTMSIESLMRENKNLKDKISKISAERDEYMRQVIKREKSGSDGSPSAESQNDSPMKAIIPEEFGENLSPTDQFIIKAVDIMKREKVIKYLYDYAFIMQIMNETDELPTFSSPKSFLNYFKELKIIGLPGEDSIKKKFNATFGKHPSWTFTDDKGKDSNEVKRRIAIGSRFLSIYRKGK